MAKLNFAKLHVTRPNTVELNRVEPHTTKLKDFEPSPEFREREKLYKEVEALTERNGKALERFLMTDDEMHQLILDNMAMQAKLLLRIK